MWTFYLRINLKIQVHVLIQNIWLKQKLPYYVLLAENTANSSDMIILMFLFDPINLSPRVSNY